MIAILMMVRGLLRAASRIEECDRGFDNHYHYTECGLGCVHLANGFEFVEVPWGNGVRVDRAEVEERAVIETTFAHRRRTSLSASGAGSAHTRRA